MLNTGLTDVNYTTLLCNGYPAYFMFVFDDNGIIFNCQVCLWVFLAFVLCLFSFFTPCTNFIILLHVYCRDGTAHMFKQTVK